MIRLMIVIKQQQRVWPIADGESRKAGVIVGLDSAEWTFSRALSGHD